MNFGRKMRHRMIRLRAFFVRKRALMRALGFMIALPLSLAICVALPAPESREPIEAEATAPQYAPGQAAAALAAVEACFAAKEGTDAWRDAFQQHFEVYACRREYDHVFENRASLPDLEATFQRIDAVTSAATARHTVEVEVRRIARDLDTAEAKLTDRKWLEAHDLLDSLAASIAALGSHEAAPALAERQADLFGRISDSGLARDRERAVAEQAEQAARAARVAACGPRPTLTAWDAEYIGLSSAVEQTANDPSSIDVSNCLPAWLDDEGCWMTECSVRGANAFGALVLNRYRFTFQTDADGIAFNVFGLII